MGTITAPSGTATLPASASSFASTIPIRARYENWIGGEYRAPVRGQYFTNISPITGQPLCEVARSTHEDVDRALDAAHAAAVSWNVTSATTRSIMLNRIADRMEANLSSLAFIETIDNGKPIRETTHADLPLAIDHFRYFAGVLRAQEGSLGRTRQRHRRLSLPRAPRRRRPDHPLELPAAHGGRGSSPPPSRPGTASCSSRPSRRR
jgi:hypothetical protein